MGGELSPGPSDSLPNELHVCSWLMTRSWFSLTLILILILILIGFFIILLLLLLLLIIIIIVLVVVLQWLLLSVWTV